MWLVMVLTDFLHSFHLSPVQYGFCIDVLNVRCEYAADGNSYVPGFGGC